MSERDLNGNFNVKEGRSNMTSGAYPEIFWGRGFEFFLYGQENLGEGEGEGFEFFSFKNPGILKIFPKKVRGFDPKNSSLNTPKYKN